MGVQFPANSHREDPYRNFKFRVKWGGETVAGLSKMSAIKRISVRVGQYSGRSQMRSNSSDPRAS